METDCPNCLATWGLEEMMGRYCKACGYPNNIEMGECPECLGRCSCDDIIIDEDDY